MDVDVVDVGDFEKRLKSRVEVEFVAANQKKKKKRVKHSTANQQSKITRHHKENGNVQIKKKGLWNVTNKLYKINKNLPENAKRRG